MMSQEEEEEDEEEEEEEEELFVVRTPPQRTTHVDRQQELPEPHFCGPNQPTKADAQRFAAKQQTQQTTKQ